jgi:hypothetical protein
MNQTMYERALAGDREAQLATMVEILAVHIGCLLLFVPAREQTKEVRTSSLRLCEDALACLKEYT